MVRGYTSCLLTQCRSTTRMPSSLLSRDAASCISLSGMRAELVEARLVPFDRLRAHVTGSGHITQRTQSADRFGKHLLLLAEGPAHVRSPGRSPVVEHLVGDC